MVPPGTVLSCALARALKIRENLAKCLIWKSFEIAARMGNPNDRLAGQGLCGGFRSLFTKLSTEKVDSWQMSFGIRHLRQLARTRTNSGV
jgi:hypothetical protein